MVSELKESLGALVGGESRVLEEGLMEFLGIVEG